MVGMVSGEGSLRSLKFLVFCWIFVAHQRALGSRITLERYNTEAVLPCLGGSAWYNPYGHRIEHDGTKYIVTQGNLTVSKVGERDLGIYYCTNGENQTVELHAKPFVKPLDKSYNVVQGHPIHVDCVAIAFPSPDVAWYKVVDGVLHNMSNNYTLNILESTVDDYGTYTCLATNMHGNSSSETKIRVKSKLAPLWPFIGILVEVIILVVIIIVYEKKKSKQENEDILKDNLQKSGENNAANVRQRK